MDAIEIVVVVSVALWLGILTLVVLLNLRQVGVLTAWMQQRNPVRDDGLDAGAPVPETALRAAPQLQAGLTYVVTLDGQCDPCRQLATAMNSSETISELEGTVTVLATVGGRKKVAQEVAALLPAWVDVIFDPEASQVREALAVQATPAITEVDSGNVTGHTTAGQGIANFIDLVEARATSDASDYAGVASDLSVISPNSKEGES